MKAKYIKGLFLIATLVVFIGSCSIAPISSNEGNKYAILIGINEYPFYFGLNYPVSDAVELGNILRLLDYEVLVITNSQATLKGISNSIISFVSKLNPSDTLVVFYAGHGARIEDESYILPYDGDTTLKNSMISLKTLANWLKSSKSQKLILFFDHCYGGEIVKYMSNAIVLTASSEDEEAYEFGSPLFHGVFTYFLIKGIEGNADLDHDNKVNLSELYRYVYVNVQNTVKKNANATQSPQFLGNRDVEIVISDIDYLKKKMSSSSQTNNIAPDNVPPEVNIYFPTNGTVFAGSMLPVVGSTTDNSGKVEGTYIKLEGDTYFSRVTGSSWVINFYVPEGTNRLYYYAIDEEGNYSPTNSIEFYVKYLALKYYVATNGSDTNDGTSVSSPLRSLQKAINVAFSNEVGNAVIIYVGAGTYSPSNGLNTSGIGCIITNMSNITIIGGWNSNFSSVSGYSVFDGMYTLSNVLLISNVNNFRMENIVVTKGSNTGLSVYNATNLKVSNVMAITNSGVGMFFTNVLSNTIFVSSLSNGSSSRGYGLVFYGDCSYVYVSSFYNLSQSSVLGGGLYLVGNGNVVSGSIVSNVAYYGSSGGVFIGGNNNLVSNISVLFNKSSYGTPPVFYITNSYGLRLINSVIRDNLYTDTSGIKTAIYLNGIIESLVISNCYIGGASNDYYGIYEGSASNVIGHKMIGNVFITNKLGYLYYDYNGQKIVSNSSWTNINDPTYSGADVSSNNIVTNIN